MQSLLLVLSLAHALVSQEMIDRKVYYDYVDSLLYDPEPTPSISSTEAPLIEDSSLRRRSTAPALDLNTELLSTLTNHIGKAVQDVFRLFAVAPYPPIVGARIDETFSNMWKTLGDEDVQLIRSVPRAWHSQPIATTPAPSLARGSGILGE